MSKLALILIIAFECLNQGWIVATPSDPGCVELTTIVWKSCRPFVWQAPQDAIITISQDTSSALVCVAPEENRTITVFAFSSECGCSSITTEVGS